MRILKADGGFDLNALGIEEIKEQLLANNIIISEFFYRDIRKIEHLRRLKNFLERLAVDFKVILYTRNQGDWITSFYSTYIKNGGALCFNDYIRLLIEQKHPSVDFNHWASVWENVFREYFYVRQYTGKSLLPEIFADLGFKDSQILLTHLKLPKKVNSHLTVESQSVLRALSILSKNSNVDCTAITQAAFKKLGLILEKNPICDEKLVLNEEQSLLIKARFKDQNIAANSRYGINLDID